MQMLMDNVFFLFVIAIGIFAQLVSYQAGNSKSNAVPSLLLLAASFLLFVFFRKNSHGSEFFVILTSAIFCFALGSVGCKAVIRLRQKLKENK